MLNLVLPRLSAVVVGAGPSAKFLLGCQKPVSQKWYGAGNVPLYLPNIDVYALGDSTHFASVPKYECQVYITDKDFYKDPYGPRFCSSTQISKMQVWNLEELSTYGHGGSSGGMALSLACIKHDTIGLIGFDGYKRDGSPYDPPWQSSHTKLICEWVNRGKRLISLMPCSVFNPDLIQMDDFLSTCGPPKPEFEAEYRLVDGRPIGFLTKPVLGPIEMIQP